MPKRFLAAQPGNQDVVTVRQFRDLEAYLLELENRLAPLWGSAVVLPTGILDPVIWTALTYSENTIPQMDGVYWASMRMSVTGTNALAWVQLRMTWGGVGNIPADELIGDQADIGNNTLESITLSGTVAVGINTQFWVRGFNSEVLAGKLAVHRIGTGDILRGQSG